MDYNILIIQSVNVFLFFIAMFVWTSVINRIAYSRLKRAFKYLGTTVSVFAILLSISFVLINYVFTQLYTINPQSYYYYRLAWDYSLVVFLILMGFWSYANIQLFNKGAYNDVILYERRANAEETPRIKRSTDIPKRRSTDPL